MLDTKNVMAKWPDCTVIFKNIFLIVVFIIRNKCSSEENLTMEELLLLLFGELAESKLYKYRRNFLPSGHARVELRKSGLG